MVSVQLPRFWVVLAVVSVLLLSSVPLPPVVAATTGSTTAVMEDAPSSQACPSTTTTVRFHFVRHGETIANREGLVVGQWDSPLTDQGVQQAVALGKSSLVQSTTFWKLCSSDLGRTRQTAALILEGGQHRPWSYDPRIREVAKGARQEYPKAWDYPRAVRQRQLDGKGIPLLETPDEVWKRIVHFVTSIINDAQQEQSDDDDDDDAGGGGGHDEHDEHGDDEMGAVSSTNRRKNVLVVSHAGTLRTLLQRMVPHAHPTLQHIDDPSIPPDETKRLSVPNTSVTIVDVTPKPTYLLEMTRIQQQQDGADNDRGRRLGPDDAFFPQPSSSAEAAEKTTTKTTTATTPSDHLQDLVQNHFDDYFDTKVIEFMSTRHLDGVEAKATSNDE
jgi:probable phosphoglycerate mutase